MSDKQSYNNNNSNSDGRQGDSNYSYAKAWGGKNNFMHSYGIKPTPDGYAQANELITTFRQADNNANNQSSGNNRK